MKKQVLKNRNNNTNQSRTAESTPRLDPIENPDSIKLKVAYWLTEKKMGKVITPLKVIQARFPETLSLAQKLMKVEQSTRLDSELCKLLKHYIAILNGCSFCKDLARSELHQESISPEKVDNLLHFEESEVYSEAEKAALRYVEQVTTEKKVNNATFKQLKRHFSEREIVEITWINALENYYNLLNLPLGIESDHLCEL